MALPFDDVEDEIQEYLQSGDPLDWYDKSYIEAVVEGYYNMKDKSWHSGQDPYVAIEYESTKFKTTTCDGVMNATIGEKFMLNPSKAVTELDLSVWNRRKITSDDFIGSAKVQLHKVFCQGYDDFNWPIYKKDGSYAGEVRLKMRLVKAGEHPPSAPPNGLIEAPKVKTKNRPSPPPPFKMGNNFDYTKQ